jgi:hypothetical protein
LSRKRQWPKRFAREGLQVPSPSFGWRSCSARRTPALRYSFISF